MSYSTVTLTVNSGSTSTNVSYTLTTTNFQDGINSIQNAMKNGGFWIQNTAAGIIYNQFIPATAIQGITLT